jgi:integrase/recombinase XerD
MEMDWMKQVLQFVNQISNNKLIKGFLEDCKLRGLSKETIQNYGSMLRIFKEFIQKENISFTQINKEELRAFLKYLKEERRDTCKRIENYFSALSSFHDYMVYEEITDKNPVLPIRKRYIRSYKKEDPPGIRKLISIGEMSMLINSTLGIREKAIITLLAKTGIRKGELMRIDLEDINWEEQSILLKPRAKRSNRLVFFDEECARILKRWIALRNRLRAKSNALFISENGNRIDKNAVYYAVARNAERVGLNNPRSPKLKDHFGPHCCRHWFTTHLLWSGMPREYVKELRGDARNEAIDIYHHIDREELRKSYLACIPQLGME